MSKRSGGAGLIAGSAVVAVWRRVWRRWDAIAASTICQGTVSSCPDRLQWDGSTVDPSAAAAWAGEKCLSQNSWMDFIAQQVQVEEDLATVRDRLSQWQGDLLVQPEGDADRVRLAILQRAIATIDSGDLSCHLLHLLASR